MFLPLPDNPSVVYSVFNPDANSTRHTHNIELARRQIIYLNTASSFLASIHKSALYVFLIVSHDRIPHAISTLKSLQFYGLSAPDPLTFTPLDIYPCSFQCSLERVPCPSCLIPSSQSPSSSACFLPRQPLRDVYSRFLEAVRDNLIHQVSVASMTSANGRPVKRLKTGFLLCPPQSSSEWGAGWEHQSLTKPLIYCHLQLYLTHSRILVHPILRPAHFLLLPTVVTLPSGTPIILLPHATPAYFLTTYTGPTDALTTQFEESFLGLGVGHWKSSLPPTGSHHNPQSSCSYIIAWINVQNKQGEDKGITVIWPTRLCLSFLPSSSSEHTRQLLPYIPDLPAQLQPSPPPPTLTRATIDLTTSTSDILAPRLPISRRVCKSLTSDSLRAFRSLTFSKSKDINTVAAEVGSYVDAVAKEREKERERIRKERETGNPSSSPKILATPNANATTTGAAAATPGPTLQSDSSVNAVAPPPVPYPNLQSAPTIPNPPHFYPTPPQTNPQSNVSSNDMPTSLVAEPVPTTEVPDVLPTPTVSAPPSDPLSSFDPFENIDSSWAQPANDGFMDMGMDFGFSMDMDPITGGGGGGSAYDRVSMEYEDAFTDDDFSFFDRPSRTTATAAASSPSHLGSGLTPAAGPAPLGFSPPIFGDGMQVSGPGPPGLTPGQPSPWVPGELAEGFSPRFSYHQHHLHSSMADLVAPDVLPLSPGQTPSSHSAPTSPNIQLSHAYEHHGISNEQHGGSVFDPIPFASSHRVTDGKYAVGKFALPSPPDEEDRTEPLPLSSYFPSWPDGWRFKYHAATNPRVGIIKKLIGVKRKSFDQGTRDHKMSPSWVREHEDWDKATVVDADVAEDPKSEAESEDDDVEENDPSPMVSRPSTPPPAYLPLGPTLLHTRFQHSELLPLSSPLRPPGAAVAPTNISTTAALTSVPTPVSPAAAIGAASEKSKSLEAAAAAVAREVVENGVWAEAWRAHSVGAGSLKPAAEVWQSDVRSVGQLLECVQGLESQSDLFQLDSLPTSGEDSASVLEKLESPMISVGKGDAVIQILPSALRFWEKLGLGPRGGKKDVTAFVLFEGDTKERQVGSWLAGLSATYAAKHLGTHTPGRCDSCPIDGMFPLRFDSFRKNLAAFITSLPPSQSNLVLYIVTPPAVMTLASPLTRQVLSAVKRTLKTYTDAQILFQFVPEQHVIGSSDNIGARDSELEILCFSLYNRILQPADRSMSRRLYEHGVRGYFQEPAFTLARSLHNKVKLVWQVPAESLDVVDRHTLLHVGYQMSPCGKWILAACVDQRGEAHDLGVWLTQSDSNEMVHVVTQVWAFALQFARRANVEWRIVIAKMGSMGVGELDAWMSYLATALPTCHELPMAHVSVLSIESDVPWSFTPPHPNTKKSKTPSPNPSRTKDKSGPIFVDASATTYAQFHSIRLPLTSSAPWSRNLCVDLSFVPDADDAPCCEDLSILPLSTTSLIRIPSDAGASMTIIHLHLLHTIKSPKSSLTIPDKETHADITRNYHDLAVLAEARCRLGVNPVLPFHLAAVEAMHVSLVRGDSGLTTE